MYKIKLFNPVNSKFWNEFTNILKLSGIDISMCYEFKIQENMQIQLNFFFQNLSQNHHFYI